MTTAGFTRSTRSEKEVGVMPGVFVSEGTAWAAGISGAPELVKDDLKTPTSETIKKATRKAIRNIKNVFRFEFFIFSSRIMRSVMLFRGF